MIQEKIIQIKLKQKIRKWNDCLLLPFAGGIVAVATSLLISVDKFCFSGFGYNDFSSITAIIFFIFS